MPYIGCLSNRKMHHKDVAPFLEGLLRLLDQRFFMELKLTCFTHTVILKSLYNCFITYVTILFCIHQNTLKLCMHVHNLKLHNSTISMHQSPPVHESTMDTIVTI